jgi:heat shock protein HtpX
MKRITLFFLTNILITAMVVFLSEIFGFQQYLNTHGINILGLALFSILFGFTGSFISLLLSKSMAKISMGVHVISDQDGTSERAILQIVRKQADRLNMKMPEVGIFQSPEINAFATGASKNNSLVAISTGLLQKMNMQQLDAVIGHEMTHISNGDMITMTLLQGLLNTFTLFFSKIVSFIIVNFLARDQKISWLLDFILQIALQMVFGVLAMIVLTWYSRQREFAADKGGAFLSGKQNMIAALQTIGHSHEPSHLDPSLQAFGIHSGKMLNLFSTHPSIEARIRALQVS